MPLPSSSRSSTSASRRNRGAKKLGGPPLLRRTAVSPVDVSSTHPIKRPSKSRKEEKEVGRESWEEIDRGTTKIVTTSRKYITSLENGQFPILNRDRISKRYPIQARETRNKEKRDRNWRGREMKKGIHQALKKKKRKGKRGRNVIRSVPSRRLRSSLVSPRVFVHDSPGLQAKTNLLRLFEITLRFIWKARSNVYPTFGKVLKRQRTGFDTVDTCYSLSLSLSLPANEATESSYRIGVEFHGSSLSYDRRICSKAADISPDVIKNWTPSGRRRRFRWGR